MRDKNRRWIILFFVPLIQLIVSDDGTGGDDSPETKNNGEKSYKNVYVPRMDYDQWKPLGRGDPLQNDPTYDYVPPVLDRVQYWVEPSERKPDPPVPGESQKTEILLLGVTSRKPAIPQPQADSRRDTYDPYPKYGSKYSQSPNNRISRPSFLSPHIPSSFLPSFFPQNKNKYLDRTAFSKGTEQRVPYTVLVPPPPYETRQPPVSQAPLVFPTSQLTTPRGVTVQPSELIFQSSSVASQSDDSITSSISWEQHSSTKQSVPPDTDFRDELVFSTRLTPPESFIRVEFNPDNPTDRPLLVAADSSHNINYVTPPPLSKVTKQEIMIKGEVSDLDISNTYVKIGKSEAKVHSTAIGMEDMPIKAVPPHPHPIQMVPSALMMFPLPMKPSIIPDDQNMPPLTMQKLHDMQTMHPPPVTMTPVFKTTNALTKLLDKEKKLPLASTPVPSESKPYVATTSTTTEPYVTTTEAPETLTTTTSVLTTDPLFKHYKQPKEPMKGPLYLIIQGHSKVKTYGASKRVNGIPVQDANEIPDHDDRFDVKHLHQFMEKQEEEPSRKGRAGNIQTLKHVVVTGLGAIDLKDFDGAIERREDDVKETELQVRYGVVDEKDVTDKYHKGIVEEARKL